MPYTVYILFSEKLDKYYIGHTADDLHERIRRHLSGHDGFTARAKDWQLAYTESCIDKSSALQRELQIKRWKSKKKIHALISSKG